MNPYLPVDLAFEFFKTFSRFEYAMKVTGFLLPGDEAKPHWDRLANKIGPKIMESDDEKLKAAIAYLSSEKTRPKRQKVINKRPIFEDACLNGNNDGSRAIYAAQRVRNNLFHGGKVMPNHDRNRDKVLIEHSLVILEACRHVCDNLRLAFDFDFCDGFPG